MVPVATWMGVADADRYKVFPNLANFNETRIIPYADLFEIPVPSGADGVGTALPTPAPTAPPPSPAPTASPSASPTAAPSAVHG